MPFDWKYPIKRIAESVGKSDVSMGPAEGNILDRFQDPMTKLKDRVSGIATDTAYSALTGRQVEDVEAKELGRETAKNLGFGQTGQNFAAQLAQYGPTLMNFIKPAPRMDAVERGVGKGVQILEDRASKGFGKVVAKEGNRPVADALLSLKGTLNRISPKDIADKALKTRNVQRALEGVSDFGSKLTNK